MVRVLFSVVGVGAVLIAGGLGFLALPVNWRIGDVWVSWSAMLQNAALVVGIVFVSWLVLWAIWRSPQTKAPDDNGTGRRE